jgi:hypothetical protein
VDALVSHVVPADRAAEAFALLDVGDPEVLQVVLDFTDRWATDPPPQDMQR